jgi:hypothetical protein
MISIIIAFAILLKCFYEMKSLRFQPTLVTFLIAASLGWGMNASSGTVALAQEPTITPASGSSQTSDMFITVITNEPQINVRMGPGSAIYPIVGQLLRGATAPALGRSPGGDWIQIEFPGAPNSKGWVYSPLVQVSSGTLQIVEPPPTPVPPATSTIDPTLAAQFNVNPTATRLPTFTPAPVRTLPVYTDPPSAKIQSPVPMAGIIIALGLLGLAGFISSFFFRR